MSKAMTILIVIIRFRCSRSIVYFFYLQVEARAPGATVQLNPLAHGGPLDALQEAPHGSTVPPLPITPPHVAARVPGARIQFRPSAHWLLPTIHGVPLDSAPVRPSPTSRIGSMFGESVFTKSGLMV